jgi:hypothetical protein
MPIGSHEPVAPSFTTSTVPKIIDAPTEMQNWFCRPNLGTMEEKKYVWAG